MDYKSCLNEIYTSAQESIKSSSDTNEIKSELIKSVNLYMDFVPKFFSEGGNKIKELYKKLKTLDYTHNRNIKCIDVCYGSSIYNEYYDGMKSFINDCITAVQNEDEESITLCNNKLNIALEKDNEFIDSLFGGKNNPVKDNTLTEAVKNLEYMIDFISVMGNIKADTESLFRFNSDNFTLVEALKLLSVSIITFINKTMINILDSYCLIDNTLSGKALIATDENAKFVLV